MRPHAALVLVPLALLVAGCAASRPVAPTPPAVGRHSVVPPDGATARATLGQLPLAFIENRGQLDPQIAYYVHGRTAQLYFTSWGMTVALVPAGRGPASWTPTHEEGATTWGRPSFPSAPPRAEEGVPPSRALGAQASSSVIEGWARPRVAPTRLPPLPEGAVEGQGARWVVAIEFVAANPAVWPEPLDPLPGVVSYFKGPAAAWHTGLPTYRGVQYTELWPGIDLVYGGTDGRLKYTFVVHPGADPRQIRLAYRGATGVALNDRGQLEIDTPFGGFHDDTPYVYQEIDGRRVEVASAYMVGMAPSPALSPGGRESTTFSLEAPAGSAVNEFVVGFELGDYDPSRTLIVDPAVLVYAGYIGGTEFDEAFAIAVDGEGNAYVAGTTQSTPASFPLVVGPDLTGNGEQDAFVVKVKADGTGLVYAGYIGGAAFDQANGIAVDAAGNAYVVGTTLSSDTTFPVRVGPDLTHNGGHDAFVAKVRADGTDLIYAGYIGGGLTDSGNAIAIDGSGAAYVTGATDSLPPLFPVLVGPDLTYNGDSSVGFVIGDAFVGKVRADGSGMEYLGYIGGNGPDVGMGVAVDRSCTKACPAYVAGGTGSTEASFPALVGPDLTHNGGMDGFVVRVKGDGTGFDYAGYIGGAQTDQANAIALDAQGHAYVTGHTQSTEATFPVLVGPDLTYNGDSASGILTGDAFVAKVLPSGAGLVYSGYIGGAGADRGNGIAVDAVGAAYVVGDTRSNALTFPVREGPDLFPHGMQDTFVAKVQPDGTGLIYAGFIGGSGSEDGNGIAVDAAGNAYVVGRTNSAETGITIPFTVVVGPDLTYGGSNDGFVAKIALLPSATPTITPTPASSATVTRTPTATPIQSATATGSPTRTATATATPGALVPVTIVDYLFQPASVTVNPGDRVRWTNQGAENHNTRLAGRWDSGTLAPGQSFTYTAAEPGTYRYRCAFHPFMEGALIVSDGTPPTPTATPSATVTPAVVSGLGFTLQVAPPTPSGASATGARLPTAGSRGVAAEPVHLSWQPGTATSSLIIRWSPDSGFAFLPAFDALLPPLTGSYVDTSSRPDPTYCYILMAVGGNPPDLADVRGLSDLLCVYSNFGFGAAAGHFAVRLDQSNTARLSWTSAGVQNSYGLGAVRFDGSDDRLINLPGTATTYEEDTTGQTTCYALATIAGPNTVGLTDRICAAPGVASFPSGARPDLGALERALTTLQGNAGP